MFRRITVRLAAVAALGVPAALIGTAPAPIRARLLT